MREILTHIEVNVVKPFCRRSYRQDFAWKFAEQNTRLVF